MEAGMVRWRDLVVVAGGTATTSLLVFGAIGPAAYAVPAALILLVGPVWALAFCLASSDDDFPGGGRSRAEWLRVLPWTFPLAPLVVPNVLLLGSFIRDSRADHGRTWLTWDRMRPGEGDRDRHWPFPPEA